MKNIFIYVTTAILVILSQGIQAQCSLSCLDEIQVSVDQNCVALISVDMVLQDAMVGCTYSLTLEELNGVPIYNPIPMDYIDRTIRANVYSGGNSCSTLINVEDKLGPLIVCPADTIVSCYEELMIDFDDVMVDNCDLTYELIIDSDEIIDSVCGVNLSAERTVTFHAEDLKGNKSAICVQLISYRRPDLADLTFPRDYDDITILTPSLKCDEANIWDLNNNYYPDPEETGAPMIEGIPIIPTENTFCEINVNFEDDTIQICGAGFKVLRTWTVLDWCQPTSPGVNPIIDLQIIKIEDDRGPIIECPDNFTTYTNHYKCSSSVIPPHPIIIQDCSEVRYEVAYRYSDVTGWPTGPTYTHNITYVEEESDSFYIIAELPVGRSWIYYNVFDECDNVTICSTYVEVLDDDVPTAVCDEHTAITLGSDGTARAYAHTFDDISKDNCEIVIYEVRRREENDCSDILFGPGVDFCCADAGNYVGVELRVTDSSGNSNSCKVQIRVDDKQVPVINCQDIVIDCTVDYTDPQYTGGYPEFHDNCDVTLSYTDHDLVPNDCGTGTFYRYWTAIDNQGLTDQCTQHVTITVFDPFNGYIDWPEDYYVESCTLEGIDPAWSGYPSFSTESCSFIAAHYEDKIYNYQGGHCYEIWRKWRVIDWCQFDRDDPYQKGSWWYTQKIYVDDPEKPIIHSSCYDVTVNSNSSTCIEPVNLFLDVSDNCTDSALIRIDYRIDTDLNGTYEIYGVGNNEVQNLPLGINRIYWTASDNCGNVSKCNYLIKVVDAKAPTPYCLGGINTVLMPINGQITLWASDLNLASFDNCDDSLRFSFSEDPTDWFKVYTCDEIGMDTVNIWVTDLTGNQDYCRTIVNIQSNSDACDTEEIEGSQMQIGGTVESAQGIAIEDVEVMLEELSNGQQSMSMSGNQGEFAFKDLIENSAYSLSAFKNDDVKNGVTTLDLVLIQKHILGLQKFTSPYHLIAADINNSKSVSASDLISLRKIILNIIDFFPNNSSWRFMDPQFNFIDPNFPWSFNEEIQFSEIKNKMNGDLMGIKIGDVNNSVELSAGGNVSSRNDGKSLMLSMDETEIRISLEEDLVATGFQFSLKIPKGLDVTSIESESIELNESNYKINEDVISFSFVEANGTKISKNENLIVIHYRALTNQNLTQTDFSLDNNLLNAEIYNTSLLVYPLTLSAERSFESSVNEFKILQNHPNPFSNGTNIGFHIPEDGNVSVNILQIDGQSIYKMDQTFDKGWHSINIDADLFRNNGVFLYYIEYGGARITNKMIKI